MSIMFEVVARVPGDEDGIDFGDLTEEAKEELFRSFCVALDVPDDFIEIETDYCEEVEDFRPICYVSIKINSTIDHQIYLDAMAASEFFIRTTSRCPGL